MIKLLIGGSPCTYWSIAQKNNRETEASGMGWELFKNYLIAREKFKPDFFLYENNQSAAQPIKDMIKHEFGVTDEFQMDLFTEDTGVRYIEINSALVSAQNRQRFYVHNCGEVKQPKDRGILLRDILESSQDLLQEPVCVAQRGRMYCGQEQQYEAREDGKSNALTTVPKDNNVAEPIRIGSFPTEDGRLTNSQGVRIYDINGKGVTQNAGGGGMGAKTGLYAVPVATSESCLLGYGQGAKVLNVHPSGHGINGVVIHTEGKSKCVTTNKGEGQKIIYPVQLNEFVITGKNGDVVEDDDSDWWESDEDEIDENEIQIESKQQIYEVRDGKITINGKQYPIKLKDGFYIIRKLTVRECARLQTMPDDYCRAVSDSQAYKGLGNGWTAEVIIHILNGALANVPRDEEIVVLSMYDGIGTGRYCLDKMGFTNVTYYAYEIDKYAMQIAKSNFADIIECGDAFQLREDNWNLERKNENESNA